MINHKSFCVKFWHFLSLSQNNPTVSQVYGYVSKDLINQTKPKTLNLDPLKYELDQPIHASDKGGVKTAVDLRTPCTSPWYDITRISTEFPTEFSTKISKEFWEEESPEK